MTTIISTFISCDYEETSLDGVSMAKASFQLFVAVVFIHPLCSRRFNLISVTEKSRRMFP